MEINKNMSQAQANADLRHCFEMYDCEITKPEQSVQMSAEVTGEQMVRLQQNLQVEWPMQCRRMMQIMQHHCT